MHWSPRTAAVPRVKKDFLFVSLSSLICKIIKPPRLWKARDSILQSTWRRQWHGRDLVSYCGVRVLTLWLSQSLRECECHCSWHWLFQFSFVGGLTWGLTGLQGHCLLPLPSSVLRPYRVSSAAQACKPGWYSYLLNMFMSSVCCRSHVCHTIKTSKNDFCIIRGPASLY